MKRFWKTVDVEKKGDVLAVTLDKRPLKTPSGNELLIPQDKKLVATLIASEWENQLTLLKPHALPMVRDFCFQLPSFCVNSQSNRLRSQRGPLMLCPRNPLGQRYVLTSSSISIPTQYGE